MEKIVSQVCEDEQADEDDDYEWVHEKEEEEH